MIDRDLAELYGVETRRLNEQVRRNIERFPENFMFQLTKEETLLIASRSKSQIATLNAKGNFRGTNFTTIFSRYDRNKEFFELP